MPFFFQTGGTSPGGQPRAGAAPAALDRRPKILQNPAMSDPTIMRLHLGAALRYEPFDAAPPPGGDGGHDDALWAFAPESLVRESAEAGPTLASPLPAPSFAGFLARGGDASTFRLAAGDYLFHQWRKADYASLEEGLEDFVRQVWWEGERTEGPWLLRVVREDGKTAFQGLRRLSGR